MYKRHLFKKCPAFPLRSSRECYTIALKKLVTFYNFLLHYISFLEISKTNLRSKQKQGVLIQVRHTMTRQDESLY